MYLSSSNGIPEQWLVPRYIKTKQLLTGEKETQPNLAV